MHLVARDKLINSTLPFLLHIYRLQIHEIPETFTMTRHLFFLPIIHCFIFNRYLQRITRFSTHKYSFSRRLDRSSRDNVESPDSRVCPNLENPARRTRRSGRSPEIAPVAQKTERGRRGEGSLTKCRRANNNRGDFTRYRVARVAFKVARNKINRAWRLIRSGLL